MSIKERRIIKFILLILIMLVFVLILIFYLNLYPLKYKKEIANISNSYQIKKELIASIVNTESSFNKNAKSSKGAVGLMQLMPATAKWVCELKGIEYKEENLTNVTYNLDLGVYYLKYLINKFDNLDNAIIAYNAGEGTVSKWLSNKEYSQDGKELTYIPYKETRDYIKKVNNGIKFYKGRL